MAETFKLGNTKWGVKEGSLLAYNDENENFKPLPFTFTRASTATRVKENGLIEVVKSGIPRIDYTDNPSGHLLLEPARTNLFPKSNAETIDDLFQNQPASLSFIESPDGTENAFVPLVDSVNNRIELVIAGGSYSSGTVITVSWFSKEISTPALPYAGNVDVSGSVNATASNSNTIELYNVNGFTRYSTPFTITDGSLSSTLRIYVGNIIGVGNASVAYYGFQAEQGSYATSYIPTNGDTETRVAETCTGAGNAQVFNDSEGVLFAEISSNNTVAENRIYLSDGTDTNRIFISLIPNSTSVFAYIRDASGVIFSTIETLNTYLINKIAIKYKSNDFALWINGVEIYTDDTNSNTLSGLDDFKFEGASGNFRFNGKIKQIGVYDTALTDEELETLTT